MANTDANKYPYTGQAEQNPYGGVSIENLVAVIAALLPKGGNNSSGQNIYAGVSPAGLADAVGLGNIQSNNSRAGNIYGGDTFGIQLSAFRLIRLTLQRTGTLICQVQLAVYNRSSNIPRGILIQNLLILSERLVSGIGILIWLLL